MDNKMLVKEIFKTNIEDFKKLRKEYSFLNLQEDYFIKIILHEISKTIDNYQDNNYKKQLIKNIKFNLDRITCELLKNSDNVLDIINRYINLNFHDTNSLNDVFKYFNNLLNFFEKNSFIPNEDMVCELIMNNIFISKSLSIIYQKYQNKIKNGEINYVISNYILVMFIESFCKLNSIEINDNDNVLVYNDMELPETLLMYMNNISNHRLLTRKEEIELFDRINNGDEDAKRIVVERNLRLVIYVAKKYYRSKIPLSDLIQEGNIGLMTAVNKFDISKGFHFSTYAFWWIKEAISRYIFDKSRIIRIPCYIMEKMSSYKHAHDKLYEKLNRRPTAEEIANYMKIDVKLVKKIEYYLNDTLSLDSYKYNDEESTLGDTIPSLDGEKILDNIVDKSMHDDIMSLLDNLKLNEREKNIIKLRFGFNDEARAYTLEEIGKVYNVSRERIRQIEFRVLNRIRNAPDVKYLHSYLNEEEMDVDLKKIIK